MRPTPYPDLPPFDPARPHLLRPVRVDPTGRTGPTPAQARGGRWRQTSRGLFVPARVDGELVEQRIVEAAAVLPSYGGVTGWAQLCWAGGRWFDGLESDGRTRRPVVLATAMDDIRAQPGLLVSAEHLDESDVMVLDGLRTTTSLRSLLFELRVARSLPAAIVAIDMAAYSDLVSLAELADFMARHVGWPGIRRARSALSLADENSWSPRETLMRYVWMCVAALPRPLTNRPVFDLTGRHVGTPDLLDPTAGVAGEYDGAVHLNRESRARDLGREDAFRGVGLEYFTMLASDAGNPSALVARMVDTRRRALGSAPATRRWTLEPPPWWVPTDTVERRRTLTPDQRRRWLARRQ
jgi:hypothetical protein